MLTECSGVVIRQIPLTENDKLLTVLTAESGKITVAAKGACSMKSKYAPSAQLFCYSNFVLSEKGGKLWLREADLIENFYSIREDVVRMALASYICDAVNTVSLEDMPETDMLRLVLNCLYAVANDVAELDLIKAAFEWRLSAQLGFEPDTESCFSCGSEEICCLDILGGQTFCRRCAEKRAFEKKTGMTRTAADAVRYVSRCDVKRLLSFAIDDADKKIFCRSGEEYLLNHVERSYESLDFYKEVKD